MNTKKLKLFVNNTTIEYFMYSPQTGDNRSTWTISTCYYNKCTLYIGVVTEGDGGAIAPHFIEATLGISLRSGVQLLELTCNEYCGIIKVAQNSSCMASS